MRPVRSLLGLGRRLLTERPGRTALTVAGIVLGVALFTGCLIVTATARRGLDQFVAEVNGQADVIAAAPGSSLSSIVSPRGGELDDTIVEELASLPDVDSAVGVLAVPSAFDGPDGATEQRVNFRVAAALVGVDLETATSIYPISIAEGRLPADGADELVLPGKVADHLGADVGDVVTIPTSNGPIEVPVVAILEERGIGRLDRIGFTSLQTARRYANQPNEVTQVAIDLAAGVDPQEWIDTTGTLAPDSVVVSTSEASLGVYRDQIGALTGALSILGLGLLLTAGFLIYLTLSMSVVERTRLYGTMVALGATNRQVRRVVLSEALVIGAVGTTAGLALGVGVAEALRLATARLLQLFGAPALFIPWWALAVSALVGMATTLGSALVPARRAARTDPIAAIRATEADDPIRSRSWILAALMLTLGATAMSLTSIPVVALGMVLVGVGAVRLVPYAVRPLARRLGPMIARLSPGGGRIAVQHLVAERTRSAYTLALVMVVMAMAVSITAIFLSFNRSLESQLTAQFGDDLQITAASTLDPTFLDQLEQLEGVAGVTGLSNSAGSFTTDAGTEDVFIEAIDPDTYFDVASYPFTNGDATSVLEAWGRGPAVIVPTATADRIGAEVGDALTMQTLEGPIDFEVAATADLNNIPPGFVTSLPDAHRLFGAVGIEEVFVRVAPDHTPEDVRTAIESGFGDEATFIVTTASELKADTRAQIGAGINSFFVLLLLAGIVGTFGLANTMAVSVFKRYREIGVLRAIGARRRQIRAMAIIEALTLVTVALVLALPLGTLLSRPLLATTRAQLGDLTVHYETPWVIVPVLAAIGVAVAVLAAIWPAHRAAHLEIDSALRFE